PFSRLDLREIAPGNNVHGRPPARVARGDFSGIGNENPSEIALHLVRSVLPVTEDSLAAGHSLFPTSSAGRVSGPTRTFAWGRKINWSPESFKASLTTNGVS